MRTDLFDFDLPPDRIALRPASPRESARLMVVRPGSFRGEPPHTPTPLTPVFGSGLRPAQAQAQAQAQAGVQSGLAKGVQGGSWVPAFAGTSGEVCEDRHIRDLPDL